MSTASSYWIQVVADLSPVSATVDFVASLYRAFILINEMIVKYGQEYRLVPVFILSLVVISMGYIQEGYLPAQMCQELRYSTPNGCCKNGIQQFCDITYWLLRPLLSAFVYKAKTSVGRRRRHRNINWIGCKQWWTALDDSSVDWTIKFDRISRVLRDRLHWLPVPQRIQYKLCLLVYKALRGLAQRYLADFCQSVSSVSARSGLRSSTRRDLVVVSTATDFGRRCFAVSAPLAWNRLPPEIRNNQSLESFKSQLKTHLFNFID